MTDLHCHILPGIDDGAADLEDSIRLLEQCRRQGVRQIALTSHFDLEKTSVESFREKRMQAYTGLLERLGPEAGDFRFKLGAEVMFSPQLLETDVHELCLEGTDVLLLELRTRYRPPFLREALYEICSQGIIPLIAHVERYPYVLDDPTLLAEWIDAGASIQIDADSILSGGRQAKMSLKFLEWGLAHVVASDAHSPSKRPQQLRQAFRQIEKQLGTGYVELMEQDADVLFSGGDPDIRGYHRPRKLLGRWI